jgi:uncharacterized protein (DUF302 family)
MFEVISAANFEDTLGALIAAIERRGLTVFARIDHAGSARDAGMEMEDEQVIVFGNPRAGTPLMRSDPRVGIELPLRMLLWREGELVRLAYRDTRELGAEYSLDEHRETLDQMAALLEQLASEAAGAL